MNAVSSGDFEPARVVHPRKARRDFLEHKRNTLKASSARAYEYPTKHFIEFLEEQEIAQTSEINGYLIEQWKQKRQAEVKPVTVYNNVKHLRVFIKWLQNSELVEYGLYDKIEVPQIPNNEAVNQDVLRKERAENVLEYLATFEYGTLYHAIFALMWNTGCRISGAMALDLEDSEASVEGDSILKFRDRPEMGTPLKNGMKGERNVTITESLAGVLNDYIEMNRLEETDDHGRDPLFTVPSGRIYRQRVYKNFVGYTRPCVYANECPHDREIGVCEAAQRKEKAPSCPSSVSLHPIRRGSITNHINNGWPMEPLSERVDVSVEVLKKHYDARSEEKARQNRRQYLQN